MNSGRNRYDNLDEVYAPAGTGLMYDANYPYAPRECIRSLSSVFVLTAYHLPEIADCMFPSCRVGPPPVFVPRASKPLPPVPPRSAHSSQSSPRATSGSSSRMTSGSYARATSSSSARATSGSLKTTSGSLKIGNTQPTSVTLRKKDIIRPIWRAELPGYAARTPASTKPTTLVGSTPSSSAQNSTFQKSSIKSVGEKFMAMCGPDWSLKENPTKREVDVRAYGLLGLFVIDCVKSLATAVKTLFYVAMPGLHWSNERNETAATEAPAIEETESAWRMLPGHLPYTSLTPPSAAPSHDHFGCRACSCRDCEYQRRYIRETSYYNRPAAVPVPALQASPAEKQENWLCKHIVWNQNKKQK